MTTIELALKQVLSENNEILKPYGLRVGMSCTNGLLNIAAYKGSTIIYSASMDNVGLGLIVAAVQLAVSAYANGVVAGFASRLKAKA